MRITDNMVTNNLLAQIQQLTTQQSQLQSEVGSGLAVTQPSDNPAVFGQVVELESQNQQQTQFNDNAGQALDLANASYSGLQSMQSAYDRASQLGALGGNGTTDASSQQAYANELDQLIQQSVQLGNSQLNGNYLYAGTADSTPPFTTTLNASGQIASVTYVGNSAQASIPLSATASVSPATSGTTNAGIATWINSMISLRDALNSGDSTAIAAANASLGSAEDTITGAVAENGAVQARIQSVQTQQQSETTELNTLISNDTNADLPTTIVQLNQTQLAYQAALQSAASIMHISILNYLTLS
jgi:flagellar hook-associated protein 3 FlgL